VIAITDPRKDENQDEPVKEHMPSPRLAVEDKSAFPLVCIGMSAGAVLPLRELFGALDAHTGMAFVIIHHLHKVPTLLPEILEKCTAMPVEFGFTGMNLQANHVYILPSGMEMSVADGFFLLQPRSKISGWTNVFTLFLNSLSHSRHPGIAVVLSGLDEDGAAALKAFKENGGITIVQEPRSAQRSEMPMAAIETGCVDYVLAPKVIAARLEEIAAGFNAKDGSIPLTK
jgi:two-component system chemotaxis response regulator CheB